jgi:hypothetical protein
LIGIQVLMLPLQLNAQDCVVGVGCPFPTSYPLIVQLRTSNAFDTVSIAMHAGVAGYFFVSAGETYEWSTREEHGGYTTYNSELTLYNGTGTVRWCHGNDTDGNGALITWTAPTNTPVFVALNAAPCQVNNSPSVLVWRCVSCADLPEVLVPASGPSEVECGTDVRLRDPGGEGYYPNYANGYTVLHATGDARIQIKGPYAIEMGFDHLRFHDGVGTTAPIFQYFESAGFINHTGQAGRPVTVAFTSDLSGFMAGFELEVTHLDECEMVGTEEHERDSWSVFPNPSAGEWDLRCPTDVVVLGMELRDIRGVLLRSERTNVRNGERLTFTGASPLPPGYYLLRLHSTTGDREVKVLIR